MKVTKIIPKTIPILILRHEKPKILSKIGQNVPYLVVLDGYTHTLGGAYYTTPSSHSPYCVLGTLALITPCFGRVAASKTILNRFYLAYI